MARAGFGLEDAILRQLPSLHYACCRGDSNEALDALTRIQSAAASASTAFSGVDEQRAWLVVASALQVADAKGLTPLLSAVQQRMGNVVSALLAVGADPRQPRLMPSLNSALHVAALKGDLVSVRHLVAALMASPPCEPQQQVQGQPRQAQPTLQDGPKLLPSASVPDAEQTRPALNGSGGALTRAAPASPAALPAAAAEAPTAFLKVTARLPTEGAKDAAAGADLDARADTAARSDTAAGRFQPTADADADMAVALVAAAAAAGPSAPERGPDWERPYSAVDLRSANGSTPLLYACGAGHLGVAAVLLKAGADPSRANDDGVTPLMAAASGGHPNVLQLLLRTWQGNTNAGAIVGSDGASGRDGAPWYGTMAAAVRAADANGSTPLHYAARRGCSRCLTLLLDAYTAAATTVPAAGGAAARSPWSGPRDTIPAAGNRATASLATATDLTATDVAASDAAASDATEPALALSTPESQTLPVGAFNGVGRAGGAPTAADAVAGAQQQAEAEETKALLLCVLRSRNAGGRDVLAEARLSRDAATVQLLEARLSSLELASSKSAPEPSGTPFASEGPAPGARRSRGRTVSPVLGDEPAAGPERGARTGRGIGAGSEQEDGRCDKPPPPPPPQQQQQHGEEKEGGSQAGLEGATLTADVFRGAAVAPGAEAGAVVGGAAGGVAEVAAAAAAGALGVASASAVAANEGGKKVPSSFDRAADAGGWVVAARKEPEEPKQGRCSGRGMSRGLERCPSSAVQPPSQPSGAQRLICRNPNLQPTQHYIAVKPQPPPPPPQVQQDQPQPQQQQQQQAKTDLQQHQLQQQLQPQPPPPPPQQQQQLHSGGGWKAVLLRPAQAISLKPAPAASVALPISQKGQSTAHAACTAQGGLRPRASPSTASDAGRSTASPQLGAPGEAPLNGALRSVEPSGSAGVDAGAAGTYGSGSGGVVGHRLGSAAEGAQMPATDGAMTSAAVVWEAEAVSWMQALLPTGRDLELKPRHLCGLGLLELSAAQLEGLEVLHRAALAQIAEARLALAVGVEVARAEEDRLRQLEIRSLQGGTGTGVD